MTIPVAGSPVSPSAGSSCPRRRGRQWLFRLLAVALSLLICLIALEVALRVLGLGYGNSPHVGHPRFHHWNPTNHSMRVWSPQDEYGGFIASFNSEGFAMEEELPPPSQDVLLVIGDSFTAAREVPQDERFGELLGERFGLPVVNFGCGSFSPITERLLLESYADRVSPRVVVLQLYANDVEGDVNMARMANVDAKGRIESVPGSRTPWTVRLGRKVYMVRLARKAWLSHKFAQDREQRGAAQVALEPWAPYFTKPLDEWFSAEELAPTETALAEIRDLCRQRGWPLLVFTVPDRGALAEGKPDYFSEYFRRWAADNQVDFVDLLPAFRQYPARELFYGLDIHFTPLGHRVTADALADAVSQVLAQDESADAVDGS